MQNVAKQDWVAASKKLSIGRPINEHEDIPENTREIRGHNVTPYMLRKLTSRPK